MVAVTAGTHGESLLLVGGAVWPRQTKGDSSFFFWLVYMISPPLCLVPQTAFHAMESATVLVLGFLPACDWVQNYYMDQLILP